MAAIMTIANLHVLHQLLMDNGNILMEDAAILFQYTDGIVEQIIIKQELPMIHISHPQMCLRCYVKATELFVVIIILEATLQPQTHQPVQPLHGIAQSLILEEE